MNKLTSTLKKVFSMLINILIIVLIIYIIYNIGKSIWRNHQINEKIWQIEAEINDLKIQNQAMQNLILYYKTDTFKELEARRKLGMKKPGEKIVIMPENEDSSPDKKEGIIISDKNQEKKPDLPNYKKWWHFITNK